MNHSVIRHCRAAASSFVIAAAAAAAAADPATNAPVVRRVQLGLTRAIQLHSRDDAVSGLRLGLLGCESRGIDGLSVCLGGNVSTADSSGLLLAGLGNGVDGTHRGVMLSLGVNYARALDGVSLSLLFGGHVEAVRGVQMGGLCSMNSTLSGVAASAVNLATYRQDGVVLGLANAAFDQQNGVAVGLVNWAGRKAAGVQAGAFNQAVDGMDGLQLGLFNTAGELRGVQVGAMNRTSAPDSAGAQIGLVNGAHHAALQIGLLNLARHLEGVQIGLLNYAEDAAVPCLPILNARF